jgi:hypothetical protein
VREEIERFSGRVIRHLDGKRAENGKPHTMKAFVKPG